MSRRSALVSIFLISLAAIVIEINYTRIFSFKLYYYFTYFIIGIALLGLGSGGALVSISARVRATDPSRLVAACCLAGSASVLVGYWIIALTPLSATELTLRPLELAKLLLLTLALFVPFLMVGVAIATILGTRTREFGRLYGADLVGAGLGCTLSVPLMASVSPPSGVMLAGLALAVASRFASTDPEGRRGWGLLAAIHLAAALLPGALPDVETDGNKSIADVPRMSRTGIRFGKLQRHFGRALFSQWSPVFRVDVTHVTSDTLLLHHDGQVGSALHRFDGDFDALPHLASDPRRLPFAVLPRGPRVLIIGAAGGHEVLASLYHGAEEVTGVELNPVTVSLVTDVYADYVGNLTQRERVSIVNAEGRSFLKKRDDRYDLIWLVAPDSYAAMNAATAGAYVLSESYLYTVEMIRESLAHLAPGGVLCAQFGEYDYENKPLRTTRYLATARAALRAAGVEPFARHVLVATASDQSGFQLSTVLLRRTPFGEAEVGRFLDGVASVRDGDARHPGDPPADGPVGAVISLAAAPLEDWLEAFPYDVSQVTDDSPFFWHFTRFRDVLRSPIRATVVDWEDSIGERVLLTLLVVASLVAAAMLLLPFAFVGREWRALPHKLPVTAYFAALGLGFMLLEISLIQMLTLFLGFPTYSLSVTLFSLLVFSGIGSLLSGRYAGRRNRALAALVALLLGLVLVYLVGLPVLVDRWISAPLGLRIAVTVALMAPLGLCLGAFLPLGLTSVASLSSHPREYVAWAWAVNGFFSVISSVLAALLAMSFGFQVVLIAAAAIYLLGVAAFARVPQPALAGAAESGPSV
ncbi:MAG: class I SAM-dependent methyltransferase [Deltaproteobacteria bacterium]|nr:MAG: class I SAM-dependent methyltransferase [Deltaproteobacteria bacterium]